MLERYGLAVVQERTEPRRWDAVADYLRQEYGPGTTPGYLRATDGQRPATRGRLRRALARWATRLARLLRRPALYEASPPRARRTACDGDAPAER